MHMFLNIIHLNFKENMKFKFISKVLKLIAKSYLNLNYLNISALCSNFAKNDKSLCTITQSYYKLKYLNISNYIKFSEISICNVICFCLKL